MFIYFLAFDPSVMFEASLFGIFFIEFVTVC